jgi:hypothetical protein
VFSTGTFGAFSKRLLPFPLKAKKEPFTLFCDYGILCGMSETYLRREKLSVLPRLPLEGKLDLTYRCNNNCRHCWLRI